MVSYWYFTAGKYRLTGTLQVAYNTNIYRVAQNKISHQTICNIFAANGLLFKILEAA